MGRKKSHLQQEEEREILKRLGNIERLLIEILFSKQRAQSATLKLTGGTMPASILVGKTATAVFTEFTGPNGTGSVIAPVGPVSFSSDNPAVATVDPVTGIATGVSAGTANILGEDAGNSIMATDVLTVTAVTPPPPVAESATVVLTAN